MHIGLIGLGKMGANMRDRIRDAGHEVTGYSRTSPTRDVSSLEELVAALPIPRVVIVMVPAGAATAQTITALGDLLSEGDLLVDGGNSKFTDDIAHAQELKAKGIGFVDCGVSGGVWGKENGYGLMCGGDAAHVEMVMPIFDALRPEGPRDEGFVHAGEVGSGHYVKMVHNGIEYGLMQAYAEGFEILHASDYKLDLAAIADLWMHGSVVRSWLLELAVSAFSQDQDLAHLKGWVADSGEGRWTVQEAIDKDVPAPVITLSLLNRFRSRQDDSYQAKVLAALRNEFGGHAVKTE